MAPENISRTAHVAQKPATRTGFREMLKNLWRKRFQPVRYYYFRKILRAARIERAWYNNRPMMSNSEIIAAIREGRLVKVASSSKFVVDQKQVQHAVLTPESKKLLKSISDEFSRRCAANLLSQLPLKITSMTRDAARQKSLIEKGFPAAKESTHGLGEAFDIGVRELRVMQPAHFKVIREILEELQSQGKINFVDETRINNALHVARHPTNFT